MNLGFCQNSVALNINFNSEIDFRDITTDRKCKFQGVLTKVEIKICL